MKQRFKKIQKVREQFFETNLKNYNMNESVTKIFERVKFLKNNTIIFNDVLDMETVLVPYPINIYKWTETPNGDPEWIYMVSRNGFLLDLAIHYKLTNDRLSLKLYKKYLLESIEIYGDYSEDNSVLWRPLDIGLRLLNWIKSFIYVEVENEFSEDELNLILNSMEKQAHFIKQNYNEKYNLSNWGVLAVSGVIATYTMFDEESDSFLIWAQKLLIKQLKLQFNEDGTHWEHSPLYHHEVMMCVVYVIMLTEYCDGPYTSRELRSLINKMVLTSYFYIDKTFKLNAINDSDPVNFKDVYQIYYSMGLYPYESDLFTNETNLFIGSLYKTETHFKKENPPEFFTGESGFFAIKNDEVYFTIANTLHGSSHGHATNGSLTLNLQGEDIFVDPGRFSYMEVNPRLMLKSEDSHNSIQINEEELTEIVASWKYNRIAMPISSITKEFDDYTIHKTIWSGKTKDSDLVLMERIIIYIKELKAIVIFNVGETKNMEEFSTNFILAPENSTRIDTDKVTIYPSEVQLWSQDNIELESTLYSKQYNTLTQTKKIILKSKDKINNVMCMQQVISWNQNIKINKMTLYQTNKDVPTDLIYGVTLENEKYRYDIAHSPREIVSGDKLFKSDFNQNIYGNLNISKNKNNFKRVM